MAENGKNPAIIICGNADLYHGKSGISLGYLFVLQGAAKSLFEFFPSTPPIMVNGIVTSNHNRIMTTMVPNGRAAVDCK